MVGDSQLCRFRIGRIRAFDAENGKTILLFFTVGSILYYPTNQTKSNLEFWCLLTALFRHTPTSEDCKMSYGWHLTAYYIPSHSSMFKLYVKIGIHWCPEVAPGSLITAYLRSGWLYYSLLLSFNLKILTCNPKWSFLRTLSDINGCQCLHNKPVYWSYSFKLW